MKIIKLRGNEQKIMIIDDGNSDQNKCYIFKLESDDGQNVLVSTILVADAMVIIMEGIKRVLIFYLEMIMVMAKFLVEKVMTAQIIMRSKMKMMMKTIFKLLKTVRKTMAKACQHHVCDDINDVNNYSQMNSQRTVREMNGKC